MKRASLNLFVLMLISFSFLACSKAPISQSKYYLEVTGHHMRKKASINTDILWVGVKRNDTIISYFEPKFFPIIKEEVPIHKVTEIYNDSTGSNALSSSLDGSFQIVDGGVSTTYVSEDSIKSKYVVFTIFDINKLVKELNRKENRENMELIMRYEHPRIITSIASIFDHETKSKIDKAGDISIAVKDATKGNPELVLKGSKSGNAIANMSDGSIYAYEFSRFCWAKDKNNQIKIVTLEIDGIGLDNSCPTGTVADVRKLLKSEPSGAINFKITPK